MKTAIAGFIVLALSFLITAGIVSAQTSSPSSSPTSSPNMMTVPSGAPSTGHG